MVFKLKRNKQIQGRGHKKSSKIATQKNRITLSKRTRSSEAKFSNKSSSPQSKAKSKSNSKNNPAFAVNRDVCKSAVAHRSAKRIPTCGVSHLERIAKLFSRRTSAASKILVTLPSTFWLTGMSQNVLRGARHPVRKYRSGKQSL